MKKPGDDVADGGPDLGRAGQHAALVSAGGDRVLQRGEGVVDLGVAGVQRAGPEPVLDLADALDDRVGEVRRAGGDLGPTNVSSSATDARPPSTTSPAARPRGTPSRVEPPHERADEGGDEQGDGDRDGDDGEEGQQPEDEVAGGGDDEEAPRPGGREVDAVRDLAAGEVAGAGLDRRAARGGARRGPAPTDGRSARRTAGVLGCLRSSSSLLTADRLLRGQRAARTAAAREPVRRLRLRARRAARSRTGRSRGRPRPRGARGSCQPPSTSGPTLPASTRSATPGRPLRSTPPEPISRSISRRSLPVRSTTRPSGLTTTRDRPAWRRSARSTAARAICSSMSASRSSSGR